MPALVYLSQAKRSTMPRQQKFVHWKQCDQMSFRKVTRNVAKHILFKIGAQLLPWKKVAQNFGGCCNYQKTTPSKRSPTRRKIDQSGHPGVM
jgi:hypothetical protein